MIDKDLPLPRSPISIDPHPDYYVAQLDMLKAGYRKLPDKESIRVKAVQMLYGDVSITDFVEWLYEDTKR